MTHQSIKHCAFKKEPSVEESIKDSVEYSINIFNDGKEVFEE